MKEIEKKLDEIAEDVRSLKSKSEKARAMREQAQGRLNTLLDRLEKEHNLTSLKDAIAELEILNDEITKQTADCETRRDELMGKVKEFDRRTGTMG